MHECMKICYLDESGGTEPPESAPEATPVLTLGGLVVDAKALPALTRDFIALKCRHFPAKFASGKSLDHILTEVKGTQILKLTRSSSRNQRRQAAIFRNELLSILEHHECLIMGKAWVKADGTTLDIRNTYGYGVQDLVQNFQRHLVETNEHGVVVADSREHKSNSQVAHSVFTQKWKSGGDAYPNVFEVPIFAASDNHAGLQIVDLLASSFLLPMAVSAYCPPRPGAVHAPEKYHQVRNEFGPRTKSLMLRYTNQHGKKSGGMAVRSFRSKTNVLHMFRPVPATAA